MIKKLQRKFIIIAMASVFIVLAVIMAVVNIVNYVNVKNDADNLVSSVAQTEYGSAQGGGPLSGERAYSTRYFTVVLNGAGNIITTNTDNIVTVTADEAGEIAMSLYGDGKTSGFYNDFRYGAYTVSSMFGATDYIYIFVDCTDLLDSFHTFLWTSIGISLAGLIVVFVLVFFLSKRAVKPFAVNEQKQKQFITDAGHEIKTPLTIISANTDVLEMLNGENEWTTSIRNQIKRLTSMTRQLVYLSRMDEVKDDAQFIDFSLSDAVEETAKQFETPAFTAGKTLTVNVEKNLTYRGKEGDIRTLVSTLLDNAVKYADEGGNIEVTLRASGKNRELCVKNNASNVPKGSHNEYFERFYRSDASRNSAAGGHGIGLSIAKAVVEKHGGKISAVKDDEWFSITAVL